MKEEWKRQIEPLIREMMEKVPVEFRPQFIAAFLEVCAEMCPEYYYDAQRKIEAQYQSMIDGFLRIARQITGKEGGHLC